MENDIKNLFNNEKNKKLKDLVKFCNENGLYDDKGKIKNHCKKVCFYAHQIIEQIKNKESMSEEEIETILISALLHDIGKSQPCFKFYKKYQAVDCFFLHQSYKKKDIRKVYHDKIGREFIVNKKTWLNCYLQNNFGLGNEAIMKIGDAVWCHNDYSFKNEANSIVFCADKIAHIKDRVDSREKYKSKIELCKFDIIKKASIKIIEEVLHNK